MMLSKAELEAVPSFSFWDKEDNDMLYIKFRDSKLYTKQVVSTGYVCNENIMSYVINGDKIEVTFNIYGNDVTFDGTIYKVTEEGEPNKLILNLDKDVQTGKWLSHTYEWCSTSF